MYRAKTPKDSVYVGDGANSMSRIYVLRHKVSAFFAITATAPRLNVVKFQRLPSMRGMGFMGIMGTTPSLPSFSSLPLFLQPHHSHDSYYSYYSHCLSPAAHAPSAPLKIIHIFSNTHSRTIHYFCC